MSAKKTTSKTCVVSYRIGIDDKKIIIEKYGSLSVFLNDAIKKEIKKIK